MEAVLLFVCAMLLSTCVLVCAVVGLSPGKEISQGIARLPGLRGNGGNGGNGNKGSRGRAYATHYWSYPPCCKNSPNYDPRASTSECTSFSGCQYMGMFAGLQGQQSFDWVQNNNIAAVFTVGQSVESWRRQWANKRLRVRDPSTGRSLVVTVVDTCGDGDCDGCCTQNANKGGGMLIDLESHTARRLFGSLKNAVVEWECLDC